MREFCLYVSRVFTLLRGKGYTQRGLYRVRAETYVVGELALLFLNRHEGINSGWKERHKSSLNFQIF